MIVVWMELWPGGDERRKRTLGVVKITNAGTGTSTTGNYEVEASHAGRYYGKRSGVYKRGRVLGFARTLSPYRLLSRALAALGET